MKCVFLVALAVAAMSLNATESLAARKSRKEQSKAAAPVAKTVAQNKKNLSRDITFGGSAVDGKYHSAGEGVAQVEGEKELNTLIGIRKNFRDRLKQERSNLQVGK